MRITDQLTLIGLARSFKSVARRAGYLWRWLGFFLFLRGTTGAPVSLCRGIVYAPQVRVKLGSRVHLGAYGIFQGWGTVTIGDRTYVGHHFSINVGSEISIGADCMVANFVSLIDNNHGSDSGAPFSSQQMLVRPIVIEDNCWIAERATILAGTTIGKGSIVAAGAVVRSDVPPGSIVGGIPARLIRQV